MFCKRKRLPTDDALASLPILADCYDAAATASAILPHLPVRRYRLYPDIGERRAAWALTEDMATGGGKI